MSTVLFNTHSSCSMLMNETVFESSVCMFKCKIVILTFLTKAPGKSFPPGG